MPSADSLSTFDIQQTAQRERPCQLQVYYQRPDSQKYPTFNFRKPDRKMQQNLSYLRHRRRKPVCSGIKRCEVASLRVFYMLYFGECILQFSPVYRMLSGLLGGLVFIPMP
ncbi:jg11085 [Pararge aegeria aegeria]|uniref:Jg11085 protein n=1 Tax=Pararge aegeria aegeria TaxID=348720 RepID=A0A8S4R5Z6_9NEOP|nr:jg11085 [Pararge aegeria aegeria]